MHETSSIPNTTPVLRAVIACGFLTSLGIGLISFTLPLVSLDAKVSGGWLGTGFAGFFVARIVSGPLGGMWADRVSPRNPLLFALALAAVFPLIYLVFPTVLALYAIQFVLGICSGLIRPVGLAVLGGNAVESERGKWFAAHALAFNVAMFVGPLAGGLLFWNRTMQPVLQALAVLMVAAFWLVFFYLPSGVSTGCDGAKLERGAFDKKTFYALLAAIFGRTYGIGLTMAFYPILLSLKLGVNGLMVGVLYSLPALFTCIGLPFVPVMKRWVKGDPVLVGMLTCAAGLMGVGTSFETWHFVVAGIVMGLGASLSIPESMARASAFMRNQGAVFGVTHVVTGLGFVLGPLFGGLIVQLTGSVGNAFIMAGLVGWACLLGWNGEREAGHIWVAYRLVLVSFLLVLLLVGLGMQRDYQHTETEDFYLYTDVAMGTVVNLTLVADSQKAADDGARKALSFMRNVQRDLDHREPQGSVGRINAAAGQHYVKPSKRAYDLIRRAVDLSHMTGGVFDPTIGALTTSPLYYVLDETIAQSKKELINHELVFFDEEGRRILLDQKGMALDLGGIAKGAVIDATVKLLRKLHIRAGIVEAGGDFFCFGERDWTVGIRHPRDKDVYSTVTVREKGVCGSGDYQQFVKFEKGGEVNLRHHIISPEDMEPAAVSAGVTVIAESAELADGLATALFVMGPNKGRTFVYEEFPDVSALWFSPDLKVSITNDFPNN